MDDESWRGGCHCGAVRYRAGERPLWVAHCHCTSCRRASGAAVSTFAGFAAEAFNWQGEACAYHSSPGVTRRFCGACGTPLSYESTRFPGEVHVLVGTLDEPAAARPQEHVHAAERLPWLHVDEHLPARTLTSRTQYETP